MVHFAKKIERVKNPDFLARSSVKTKQKGEEKHLFIHAAKVGNNFGIEIPNG